MRIFIPIAVIFASLVIACTDRSNDREEVIGRFPGGEKQVVVRLIGEGKGEKLIERYTYDESGDLLLYEDLGSGITKNWLDLNTWMQTKDGLREYLLGEWEGVVVEEPGKYTELTQKTNATFSSDIVLFKVSGHFARFGDPWNKELSGRIEYGDDFSVTITYQPEKVEEESEPELEEAKISILGKSELRFLSGNEFFQLRRVGKPAGNFNRSSNKKVQPTL